MNKLMETIGYHFENEALLIRAMTHSSYLNEHQMKKSDCYERLEFLGDAILEMVSSEFIYKNFPDLPEGEMSKLRASLVCEQALSQSAKEISLGSYLRLSKGMELTGGRTSDSITADAFEALIAAIYLDSNLENAKKLIYSYVLNDIEDKVLYYDAKTTLQEIVQEKSLSLEYREVEEYGPEHDKVFVYAVYILDKKYGEGTGHNKKQAQQSAAFETIKMIRNNDLCI